MRFSGLAVLVIPFLVLSGAAHAQNDLFDPIWATMTQDAGEGSPGCRGCHVAPQPGFGRWFGDTRDDVLSYFLDGPGAALVAGCRDSRLAAALGLVDGVPPFMPRDAPIEGRFWMDDPVAGLTELTDLGSWLDSLCVF